MFPRLALFAAAVAVVGCSSFTSSDDPGLVETTTSTSPPSTTTTTTTLPTTTTTLPVFHVSGRITDDGGEPVARAFVTMGEERVITGPDGWFSFATQSPGEMTVSKPGWTAAELAWDPDTTFYETAIAPQIIRGLRVSADAAQSDEAFAGLLAIADDTAVNALVFDSKQEGGVVLYESGVAAAHDIDAVQPHYDPVTRIAEAHEHGLYTITRIVTFEDARRSAAFPEENLAGPWLDPAAVGARDYNLAIAEEACALGFDEIQFDYVRYPSGRAAEVSGQRDLTQEQRLSAISGFLQEARDLLHPMGCAVSAAVFGIVVSSPDDQGLGQRPEEVSAQVDVLSPMVYPSHYSPGWLGFDDPNDHPYDVTADALADASARMADGARLRPYLQAFWWTNSQIRTSIQAAEDAGTGWMLWNILSNYDREALPTDADVSG